MTNPVQRHFEELGIYKHLKGNVSKICKTSYPHMYSQMIFGRHAKIIQWRKDSFFFFLNK